LAQISILELYNMKIKYFVQQDVLKVSESTNNHFVIVIEYQYFFLL